jgi:lytic murein transglycosylase
VLPKIVIIAGASAGQDQDTMTLRHLTLTLFAALAMVTPAAAQFWVPAPQRAQPAQKATPAEVPHPRPDPAFAAFLQELWPDAQAKGVTRATFDLAFAGVTPDPRVMAITQRQPEYGKPAGTYIAMLASKARVEAGARKAQELAPTLDAIEARYGVDRYIILAIWGIETSYGSMRDRWDVIRSLATLAQARYRHPYFRNELITALLVLQGKHIARNAMVGSWAGAMGQPQFMPSSFMEHAVDFSGDGRRDIWTNVPDVLASIANFLQKGGWKPGLTYGFEVKVPTGFDYRKSRGSFADWSVLGLRRADGTALPADDADAILFFPSGARGPAFLVTDNFVTIKRYNNSDVYALAAAQLADRMQGRAPSRTEWPADDRQLSVEERIALQRKFAELGYKVRNFTGHFDFDLRDAIREEQAKFGLVPDGHPTIALFDRLGVRIR